MKNLYLTCLIILFGTSAAFPLPPLQLYIDGAEYDQDTETWIVSDRQDFDLYIVGQPSDDDRAGLCDDRELEDVHLVISTISDQAPEAQVTINGEDYPVEWRFGAPQMEPCFPPHDIFPAWYFLFDIGDFEQVGGIGDIVPDSDGQYWNPSQGYSDSSHHRGEIKTVEISVPGDIYDLHFDAVSLDDEEREAFAPFSHDAGYYDSEHYPPTVIDDNDSAEPKRIDVFKAYPNPFNAETMVSFTLNNTSRASLIVYDLQGRHVASLTDDVLGAGQHQVRWDGRNESGQTVASGIYLLNLKAGEQSRAKSVILLK